MTMLGLSALPAWNQLSITLPDGAPDPQHYNDCGETCVAAIVACVHGVRLSPASIRADLGGPSRTGLTTAGDLVSALLAANVAAESITPTWQELQGVLTHYTNLAQATIVLGQWPTPGGALHWMNTTGTTGTWQYNNPWGGTRSWLGWHDVQNLYGGFVVVVNAQLHYDMHDAPQPY